jgi:uncharacterized protein YcbX
VLLEQLNLHPLKSGAALRVGGADVTPAGLAGDRRWMVTDPGGTLLSARELPALLGVRAEPRAASLRLRLGEHVTDVPEPGGDPVPVRLHRHELRAVESVEGGRWLSEVLGRDVRLVWCDDPTRRPLNPAHSRPGDHTAFADGYPVTLASRASMDRLRDWMTESALERGEAPPAFGLERFRANLVVDGGEPFEEDGWTRVRVGDVAFRVATPVDRCMMTTVDPATLERSPEPIRTLARHRQWDHSTWFAIHLVPERPGRVRTGDEVVASAAP